MLSSRSTDRKALINVSIDTWPTVDSSALSGEGKVYYERRETAVKMYAQKFSLKEIELATTITPNELYRVLDKCLAVDGDGRMMGFAGLVKYKHNPALRLNDPAKLEERTPKPGSLGALFAKYPSIRNALHNYAVHGKLPGIKSVERNAPFSAIHGLFTKLCEKAKIRCPHYPFNSPTEGRPALRRWVNLERNINWAAFLKSSDPDAAAKLAVLSDRRTVEGAPRFFKQVQCDGHKIDYRFKVEIPSPTGKGVIYAAVRRIWIIVLIEVVSRAIIGYTFAFGKNYSAVDILRAVRNSLLPWEQRKLTVTTVHYREGDGLPSGVIEGLSYACFDQLHIDNAKAHLSSIFLDPLDRMVGAVPVFPPSAAPNSQAFIEGFFNLLEEAGLHRMSGTTGSNPEDPRNDKSETNLEYRLNFDLLADFMDLLISRINGSRAPDSSISRLEILRRMVERRTVVIRRIPRELRAEILRHDMWGHSKIGLDHGRPCVRFHGARYYNKTLDTMFRAVKAQVLVKAWSEDLKEIECTLIDGTPLGILLVERRWQKTPHSLQTRKEICRLLNAGYDLGHDDLPTGFRLHMEQEARESKDAAAKLARVQREQKVKIDEPTVEITGDFATTSVRTESDDDEDEDAYNTQAYAEAEKLLADIRTQYR